MDDDADGDGGGKSFSDLKNEYESGDADWAEEDDLDADTESFDDGVDPADDDGDALADDELFDEVVEEAEAEPDTDAEAADAATPVEDDLDEATGLDSADAAVTDDGKPYLSELPDGYAGDVLAIEWLQYLVESAGIRATARAISYYEDIDWIAEPVADDLQDYLVGFEESDVTDGDLTIDHHMRSLKYIGKLDGNTRDTVALSGLLGHGGGPNGVQR